MSQELAVRTRFVPSEHGFAFANYFPKGTPVFVVRTPFGKLRLGDASAGLCGGMVYAAMDGFHTTTPPAIEQDEATCLHLGRRLLTSWNFPFGVLKYYDWQCRPTASKFWNGVRIVDGTRRLTILNEWPKVRKLLDNGQPAALGLVQAAGWNPLRLSKNHQVLGIGYVIIDSALSLHIYDPNHPCNDVLTLTLNLNDPDHGEPITHSVDGSRVRGFFLTEYQFTQ